MAGTIRKTLGIIGQATLVGVALIEDYLDTTGSRRTREELLADLREARERHGELALKVADLEDQCVNYRYLLVQGPRPSHFEDNMLGHIHGPSCDIDDDPYEGSFHEAADNEGARLARESTTESDNDIPF